MAHAGKIHSNSRIAKNTLLLYVRTLFTMLISLYTSRIVLNALGVEDFGIYSVIGGLVGMFALLSGSMTVATQRFISYELGKKDGDSNHVFSATLTIHMLIAVAIVVVAETVGLWFLNAKLNIAPDRMFAANVVYQFSVFNFVINIISIPYNGLIIAHERMDAFAIISIIEAVLKLIAVLLLTTILYDRLIVYAFFMFVVALIIRVIYGVFCARTFTDSKYRFFRRSPFYKRMLGFTGWNMLGNSSVILSNQGVNVLINIFFGVVPNAARGIAVQVDNALQSFVTNFTMALNPQITKAYASGDKAIVATLVNQGGKLCFLLFLLGAAPIVVCAPEILELWLKIVPDYAVIFVRLSLVYILVQTWSQTLYTLMLSNGNIKIYQIVVGGCSLLTFPITWILFVMGYDVISCYYAQIAIGVLCLLFRLKILQNMGVLKAFSYVKSVIVPSLYVVIVLSVMLSLLMTIEMHWILRFVVSFIVCIVDIYVLGLNKSDKQMISKILSSLRSKVVRR